MANILQKLWRGAMLTAALATSLTANADLLWSDSFDYNVGDLYGQGSWWRLAAAKTNEPVQIVEDALTYPGYQTTAVGKAVQLIGTANSSTSNESVKKEFAADPVLEGTLYYSLLVKPMELPMGNTNKYVISGLAGKNFNGWGDGVGNTSIFATVSVAPGTEEGKFKFGFATSTSTPTYIDGEYDLGETYLVVVKYDFATKDISFWLNPADATADATATLAGKGSISTSNGVQGLCLNQQGNPNILGNIIVDNARVATDMASLFTEEKPQEKGELLWSDAFSYKAGDLYGQGSWVRLNKNTDDPIQVIDDALTFPGYQSEAVGKAVMLAGTTTKPERLKKKFSDEPVLEGALYYSMLVKPMEFPPSNTTKYVISGMCGKNSSGYDDGVGGTTVYATVSLNPSETEGKFKFGFSSAQSVPTVIDVDYDLGKTYLVVAKYDFATKDVSFWINPADAKAEPTGVLEGKGSISTTNGVQGLCLYQQGNALAEGKIIVDHVRIATAMAPLFKEESAEGPDLRVTQVADFTGDAAPINQETRFATFTVDAKNLTAPASVWLGGADRANFSLSTEEIPAGTGTYEVVVTYKPTAIGKHSATVNFDATPTELSGTYALAAAAYDPENLPAITIPATVDAFSAEPNKTDEKTITISSANMFDYVYLALEDQSAPGTFRLDQGMLLGNGSYDVKISFNPTKEGDFTAKLKVYSTMVDAQYIELSGVSKGTVPPEPKEGGELVLDKTNALSYMVETFDTVSHNKPLALEGWDNVAVTGSRAWWGYQFSAGDHGGAAKVTVYDSSAEYDTQCEMLLVTPALDFKNAKSKVFTCSVMGDFLPSAGTTEILEVLYIEDKDYMQPIGGLDIPYISDQSKEWFDYVIDFEGQELADTFFIGFRLKSYRGTSNAQTYYVDGVSWGRTDIPQVKADTRLLSYEAETGSEVTSPVINVVGLNLTEDIKVKVYGADGSLFEPSVTTLPATGGELTLKSTFSEARDYVAYVELTSAGSGAFIIEVNVSAQVPSGITGVDAKNATVVEAYDLMGRKLNAIGSKGVYIINGKKIVK